MMPRFILGLLLGACWVSAANAQNSSLLHVSGQSSPVNAPAQGAVPMLSAPTPIPQVFGGGVQQQATPLPSPTAGVFPPVEPMTSLQGVSWTYQAAPPLRSFRIQDPITIRVDEITRMQAEGEQEKRRISLLQATLAEWVRLGKKGLQPDPQSAGDPRVDFQSRANSVNEASVESRESLTFNITARVVDIQPNGNLVLEARKTYRVNDNLWETSVSGICRAADVGPDNTVLSRDLIDLEIHKEDQGQLRDGMGRGWLQRFFDRVKPF